MSGFRFPEGFLWGAATSSHQVEGNNHNDWSDWERAGHILDHSLSGKAADHWNRYEEDFALLKSLGLNSYRLSLEWSRIEPIRGKFDYQALDHYEAMIDELLRLQITPMVTLHHFTLPQWVARQGGWSNRRTVQDFNRFTMHVLDRLGAKVQLWCTINEPTIEGGLGYMLGLFPPGLANPVAFIKSELNLARAHRLLYRNIHHVYAQRRWTPPKVGMAHHLVYAVPCCKNPGDAIATKIYSFFSNAFFLLQVRRRSDYIGVNYYFAQRIHFGWREHKFGIHEQKFGANMPVSDLGWQIYPQGLYYLTKSLRKYKKPIYITENGLADAHDTTRPWSIVHHLSAIEQAIAEGSPIQGYFHWSLIDTFEWENGYRARYGLIAVDFDTQKRTIRKSAKLYGQIARANTLNEAIIARVAK